MSRHTWSEAEKEFVRQNAGRMKDADVAATLSRICGRAITVASVRHCRQNLGLKKRRGRGLCEVLPPQDDTPDAE
jgi:hypothetical protein